MLRQPILLACLLAAAFAAVPSHAQNRSEDAYPRYELLAPETASFRITYDVTAVTPDAKFFSNAIRKGSQASDGSVVDMMTGAPLEFKEVTGQQARDAGLKNADLDTHYIQVALARPVPDGGEGRIRILKTYKDPKSYYRDGDRVVFDRRLGIRRNAIVLPKNYELVATSIPVQVVEEADGRIAASFMNIYPGEAPLVLKPAPIAPLPPTAPAAAAPRAMTAPADPAFPETPMNQIRVGERALQDREKIGRASCRERV